MWYFWGPPCLMGAHGCPKKSWNMLEELFRVVSRNLLYHIYIWQNLCSYPVQHTGYVSLSGLQGNSNAPRVSGSIWVAVGRHDLMVRGRARGIPNGELRNYVVWATKRHDRSHKNIPSPPSPSIEDTPGNKGLAGDWHRLCTIECGCLI